VRVDIKKAANKTDEVRRFVCLVRGSWAIRSLTLWIVSPAASRLGCTNRVR